MPAKVRVSTAWRSRVLGHPRRRTKGWKPALDLDPVLLLCRAHELPEPERELVFHPGRRWRADYCWLREHVILEIEGGLYAGGRTPGTGQGGHSTARGILRDMEKSNAAQLLGYRYFRLAPWQIDLALVPLLRVAFSRPC